MTAALISVGNDKYAVVEVRMKKNPDQSKRNQGYCLKSQTFHAAFENPFHIRNRNPIVRHRNFLVGGAS